MVWRQRFDRGGRFGPERIRHGRGAVRALPHGERWGVWVLCGAGNVIMDGREVAQ